MLGTSDAKYFNWEGIQQNTGDYFTLGYVDTVKQLRQSDPPPVIYVLGPPPLYEPYPFGMNATIINSVYSTLIRDVANVTDTHVIDIFSAYEASGLSETDLSCDGCHPTADGNIAQTIYDAVYI
mmetsp:Transcript_29566/g.49941  ORF Transcript_29566/g.49941 Transcript_29566/m.49941 type:complete len:124 (-) Transcript_29566:211-582(-)